MSVKTQHVADGNLHTTALLLSHFWRTSFMQTAPIYSTVCRWVW